MSIVEKNGFGDSLKSISDRAPPVAEINGAIRAPITMKEVKLEVVSSDRVEADVLLKGSVVVASSRRNHNKATTAAEVLPIQIEKARRTLEPGERLTQKAPSAIPGAALTPHKSRAASAIPLGGQRSVAYSPING
jgi:hypothetical protein